MPVLMFRENIQVFIENDEGRFQVAAPCCLEGPAAATRGPESRTQQAAAAGKGSSFIAV